jgi:hypothetical protein
MSRSMRSATRITLDLERPLPRAGGHLPDAFWPAPEVEEWFRAVFLDPDSPLYNPEHEHLNSARVGVLWTTAECVRQMKRVVGQVELPKPHPALGKWAKSRWEYQIRQWFGRQELDFLMTLDAPHCAGLSDLGFCALVEHELYRCAQKLDAFGLPAFNLRTGRPKFAIKGHDVEEHVGIVRRYGARAGAGETLALVETARKRPEVSSVEFAGSCGVCLR